jgi:ketosteroid isomerase-like protein
VSARPSNADLVRAAILAQNAGDDDALLGAMAPDIEWHTDVTGTGDEVVVRGREAMRELVGDARRQVGELRVTLHELEESGDAVFVAGTISAANGLNMPRAWIWRLRDGLAYRVDSFPGRDVAQRAWQRILDED